MNVLRGNGLKLARLLGHLGFCLLATPSFAEGENVKVFGIQAGPGSKTPGAFIPAATKFACYAMKGGECWDGKTWQRLFPAGPRKYIKPDVSQVACSVIIQPENDCWTGQEWYRLPTGQLLGIVGGFGSAHPNAFITAPLR